MEKKLISLYKAQLSIEIQRMNNLLRIVHQSNKKLLAELQNKDPSSTISINFTKQQFICKRGFILLESMKKTIDNLDKLASE